MFESLLWAFLSFFLLIGANKIGIINPFIYGAIGILSIWTGFFLSGVHAAFAGIGFTMSIFIGELAFENESYVYQGKLAILVAFVLAVLLGLIIFKFFVRPEKA